MLLTLFAMFFERFSGAIEVDTKHSKKNLLVILKYCI